MNITLTTREPADCGFNFTCDGRRGFVDLRRRDVPDIWDVYVYGAGGAWREITVAGATSAEQAVRVAAKDFEPVPVAVPDRDFGKVFGSFKTVKI